MLTDQAAHGGLLRRRNIRVVSEGQTETPSDLGAVSKLVDASFCLASITLPQTCSFDEKIGQELQEDSLVCGASSIVNGSSLSISHRRIANVPKSPHVVQVVATRSCSKTHVTRSRRSKGRCNFNKPKGNRKKRRHNHKKGAKNQLRFNFKPSHEKYMQWMISSGDQTIPTEDPATEKSLNAESVFLSGAGRRTKPSSEKLSKVKAALDKGDLEEAAEEVKSLLANEEDPVLWFRELIKSHSTRHELYLDVLFNNGLDVNMQSEVGHPLWFCLFSKRISLESFEEVFDKLVGQIRDIDTTLKAYTPYLQGRTEASKTCLQSQMATHGTDMHSHAGVDLMKQKLEYIDYHLRSKQFSDTIAEMEAVRGAVGFVFMMALLYMYLSAQSQCGC